MQDPKWPPENNTLDGLPSLDSDTIDRMIQHYYVFPPSTSGSSTDPAATVPPSDPAAGSCSANIPNLDRLLDDVIPVENPSLTQDIITSQHPSCSSPPSPAPSSVPTLSSPRVTEDVSVSVQRVCSEQQRLQKEQGIEDQTLQQRPRTQKMVPQLTTQNHQVLQGHKVHQTHKLTPQTQQIHQGHQQTLVHQIHQSYQSQRPIQNVQHEQALKHQYDHLQHHLHLHSDHHRERHDLSAQDSLKNKSGISTVTEKSELQMKGGLGPLSSQSLPFPHLRSQNSSSFVLHSSYSQRTQHYCHDSLPQERSQQHTDHHLTQSQSHLPPQECSFDNERLSHFCAQQRIRRCQQDHTRWQTLAQADTGLSTLSSQETEEPLESCLSSSMAPKSPPSSTSSEEAADGASAVRLYRFLMDELEKPVPEEERLLVWEDRSKGVFRIVQKKEIAEKWGRAKNNPSMTYDKFSRSLRYYYRVQQLIRVPDKPLVYQFGPQAHPDVWHTITTPGVSWYPESPPLPTSSSSSRSAVVVGDGSTTGQRKSADTNKLFGPASSACSANSQCAVSLSPRVTTSSIASYKNISMSPQNALMSPQRTPTGVSQQTPYVPQLCTSLSSSQTMSSGSSCTMTTPWYTLSPCNTMNSPQRDCSLPISRSLTPHHRTTGSPDTACTLSSQRVRNLSSSSACTSTSQEGRTSVMSPRSTYRSSSQCRTPTSMSNDKPCTITSEEKAHDIRSPDTAHGPSSPKKRRTAVSPENPLSPLASSNVAYSETLSKSTCRLTSPTRSSPLSQTGTSCLRGGLDRFQNAERCEKTLPATPSSHYHTIPSYSSCGPDFNPSQNASTVLPSKNFADSLVKTSAKTSLTAAANSASACRVNSGSALSVMRSTETSVPFTTDAFSTSPFLNRQTPCQDASAFSSGFPPSCRALASPLNSAPFTPPDPCSSPCGNLASVAPFDNFLLNHGPYNTASQLSPRATENSVLDSEETLTITEEDFEEFLTSSSDVYYSDAIEPSSRLSRQSFVCDDLFQNVHDPVPVRRKRTMSEAGKMKCDPNSSSFPSRCSSASEPSLKQWAVHPSFSPRRPGVSDWSVSSWRDCLLQAEKQHVGENSLLQAEKQHAGENTQGSDISGRSLSSSSVFKS